MVGLRLVTLDAVPIERTHACVALTVRPRPTVLSSPAETLIEAGVEAGLKVANEGFPDRNYNPDGTLVSRKEAHAIILSPDAVAIHARDLIENGILFGDARVKVDTLCLHGDHPHAAQNAKALHDVLKI